MEQRIAEVFVLLFSSETSVWKLWSTLRWCNSMTLCYCHQLYRHHLCLYNIGDSLRQNTVWSQGLQTIICLTWTCSSGIIKSHCPDKFRLLLHDDTKHSFKHWLDLKRKDLSNSWSLKRKIIQRQIVKKSAPTSEVSDLPISLYQPSSDLPRLLIVFSAAVFSSWELTPIALSHRDLWFPKMTDFVWVLEWGHNILRLVGHSWVLLQQGQSGFNIVT